jgi:hypothetical protein
MKQEFPAHFLAIFLALSVHHAAYAQLAQNDHADRVSDATYKELNGIERDQHREIRQTQGTKPATTPFHQLIAKYDLTPRSYDCPVYFGQPTVRPGFSQAGIFRSAAIDEVVGRLQSGSLTPDDVPIQFIWVDGNRVTVNNRSLTALYKAGMRPTKLFDRTDNLPAKGVDTLEDVLLRRSVKL